MANEGMTVGRSALNLNKAGAPDFDPESDSIINQLKRIAAQQSTLNQFIEDDLFNDLMTLQERIAPILGSARPEPGGNTEPSDGNDTTDQHSDLWHQLDGVITRNEDLIDQVSRVGRQIGRIRSRVEL